MSFSLFKNLKKRRRPNKKELNTKLDAFANLVNDGNLGLALDMIAASNDGRLFESLLAGSTIHEEKWVLGVGLERFGDYAGMVGLLAWACAPEDTEMDGSFKDKTQRLELEVGSWVGHVNLESITACLKEHITPRFTRLEITGTGRENLDLDDLVGCRGRIALQV